ncbi:MAG: M23 family metallopeptidase [Bacilli bacterium]|nr:M23 family metallopeptidase [Bacilli bacterium]
MEKLDEVKNRIKNKSNNKSNSSNKDSKNYLKICLVKFFIVVIIFACGTILVRKDAKIKNAVYNHVYNSTFSFAYFKNIYNKYIGNILPFQNIFQDKKVFNEKLEYKSLSKYNKGVKLTLSDNYAIPIIKGGIVIFAGEKEGMGKTIIIQQSDGVDVWYGNLANTTMKLYDYVEDNAIVGEASNNELYMLFQKSGVEIDYKEVLK